MKNKTYLLLFLLLFVIVLWIVYPIIMARFIPADNIRGLFGDSYGALNTLFSGFAFVVLIYTIIQQNIQLEMQKEELSLQRNELELTRIELNRSADAQESTEKSIKNQAKLMEYSSRLDGLRTLLQTYNDNSTSSRNTFQDKEIFRNKAKVVEQKIEKLIEELSVIII